MYDKKRGEYPATNYGMSRAKGDIIGILHSDDMYPLNALSHVAERFSRDNGLDVLCPRVLIMADNGGRTEIELIQTDLSREPRPPGRQQSLLGSLKSSSESAVAIGDTYRYAGFREWLIKLSGGKVG